MMFYSDDPVRDYDRYCDEQERWLKKLPVCCECEEHIQQESAVRIDGEWYCDACLDDMRTSIDVD